MLIEETVTYLEMTAADQLRPGRLPPAPVEMVKLDQTAASVLRRTYARIAAPLGWQSRRTWSDAQWAQLLARPQVQVWHPRIEPSAVEAGADPGPIRRGLPGHVPWLPDHRAVPRPRGAVSGDRSSRMTSFR
jgi:hypothetical protein